MNLLKYNTKEKNSLHHLDRKLIVAPEDTDEIILMLDIYIPEVFKKSKVKEYKIERVMEYYMKFGRLDKAVTLIPEINEQGSRNSFILVDGYSRYKVCQDYLKSLYIPVKYITFEQYFNNINI